MSFSFQSVLIPILKWIGPFTELSSNTKKYHIIMWGVLKGEKLMTIVTLKQLLKSWFLVCQEYSTYTVNGLFKTPGPHHKVLMKGRTTRYMLVVEPPLVVRQRQEFYVCYVVF